MYRYRALGIKMAFALALLLLMPFAAQAAGDLPGGVLTIGSRGPEVKTLQEALNVLGYGLVEDGIYGPGTRWAVLDFQRRHDELGNDGVYGPRIRSSMMVVLHRAEDELPPDYLLEDLEEDLTLTLLADQQGRSGLVSQAFVEENRHLLRVA